MKCDRYAKGYDPGNWFTIDEETAEITLNKMPDRESPYVVNGTYLAKILCMTNGQCFLHLLSLVSAKVAFIAVLAFMFSNSYKLKKDNFKSVSVPMFVIELKCQRQSSTNNQIFRVRGHPLALYFSLN